MKKHQKHTALKKPNGGLYHKNEIGIIGAPCSVIESLVVKVKDALSNELSLGYMDADHNSDQSDTGFSVHYTDKIDYHQLAFQEEHPDYSLSQYFHSIDLLLVNGNHFKADKQIVLINEKKKDSLHRKLDRITDVLAFVLDDGIELPHHFLPDAIKDYQNIPIIRISDVDAIVRLIRSNTEKPNPSLHGLLLYGGKSQRMGIDKGKIEYHGIPQIDYLLQLLSDTCVVAHISKATLTENDSSKVIPDTFVGLGPYGGILSAFRYNPNVAYLTLPCDVPLIQKDTIEQLISNRDTSKIATCFHNNETGFPEPLITIWEPRAYPRLLHFLSKGYSCPRKVLINSDIKEIAISNNQILFNANTSEEAEIAKKLLESSF